MLDRSYLARGLPTMLVWGARDTVLPVDHAHRAHAAMPGSRLEIFPGEGHFPFRSDPAHFVGVLEDFIASTEAADWSVEQWRELLRGGRAVAYGGDDPAELATRRRPDAERSAT